ncbi:NUDIX domain-containing protein [Nocardiopsis sp. NPDC058631]|uniref:NUDIX hydrolase n=1 Tax=Nocardiopsis sp. NPDC058631 TaxID=3346566 RepID=UPI0036644CD7
MSSTPPAQPGTPAVIDALAWVHVRDGRLLCVRTEGVDLFYLPGGKREPGESDEAAVAREAREEVGVVLRPGTFRRVTVIDELAYDKAPGTRVRLACYSAEHDGEPAVANEIAELDWIGFSERERCAPAVRRLIETLHAQGTLA